MIKVFVGCSKKVQSKKLLNVFLSKIDESKFNVIYSNLTASIENYYPHASFLNKKIPKDSILVIDEADSFFRQLEILPVKLVEFLQNGGKLYMATEHYEHIGYLFKDMTVRIEQLQIEEKSE